MQEEPRRELESQRETVLRKGAGELGNRTEDKVRLVEKLHTEARDTYFCCGCGDQSGACGKYLSGAT